MKPRTEAFLNSMYTSNWVSSILGGILMALSFSPFNMALLTIPGFILMLRVADRSRSFGQVMYYSYPGFLVWNIITTYWLTFATLAGGIAAITANAVIMTIPLAFIHVLRRAGFGSVGMALMAASVWVSYEFLHLQWDLAWPWLVIGNAYANWPALVQYIEVSGSLGISFWSVFTASLLLRPGHFAHTLGYVSVRGGFEATSAATSDSSDSGNSGDSGDSGDSLTPPNSGQLPDEITHGISFAHIRLQFEGYLRSIPWPHLAYILILPAGSLVWHTVYSPKPVATTEIVVVQPNFDSYLDAGGYADASEALESIISLTDGFVTENTEAIYWPENALRSPVFDTMLQFPTNRMLAQAHLWGAPVITGTSWYKYYADDELPRVYRTSAGGLRFNVYNAAVGFYPDGSMLQYRKAKLVPIVERFPFIELFSYWNNPWFDWPALSGYGKGREIVNFPAGSQISPALVCYDSVFPDWVRAHVLEGAGYVTIITNDGWWGDTSGHVQHFDFARLRAIETRRAVVRSANNGISGMIGPKGEVIEKTDYWVRTALNLEVPIYDRMTFYTAYGDWIGWFSLSLAFLSLGWIRINNYKRKGRLQHPS